MSTNLNGVNILNIKGVDYCCIISAIIISEAVSLLRNSDSMKKVKQYKIKIF